MESSDNGKKWLPGYIPLQLLYIHGSVTVLSDLVSEIGKSGLRRIPF